MQLVFDGKDVYLQQALHMNRARRHTQIKPVINQDRIQEMAVGFLLC